MSETTITPQANPWADPKMGQSLYDISLPEWPEWERLYAEKKRLAAEWERWSYVCAPLLTKWEKLSAKANRAYGAWDKASKAEQEVWKQSQAVSDKMVALEEKWKAEAKRQLGEAIEP